MPSDQPQGLSPSSAQAPAAADLSPARHHGASLRVVPFSPSPAPAQRSGGAGPPAGTWPQEDLPSWDVRPCPGRALPAGAGGLPRGGGPHLDKGGHGPFPLEPSPRSHGSVPCGFQGTFTPAPTRTDCWARRGSWGFVSVLGDDRSRETLPPSPPFLYP